MNHLNRILNKLSENKNIYFLIFFVVLIFLTSAMMYFYQPMCPGGDFYVHYNRMQILMEALKDGSFPSYLDYRILNGHGYFLKAFYPDFILIPFAAIGNYTSVEFALQILIFVTTLLCGIFTYLGVKRILKDTFVASMSALLFTFAAYRIFDFYVRGAIGEAISFTFIPIIFWGLYEIIKGDCKRWYIIALGFTFTLFSHLIASVLSFITVVIFLLIYNKTLRKEPQRMGYLVLAGGVTLVLAAYFIYPMLEQMLSNTFYYTIKPYTTSIANETLKPHDIIVGMINGISTFNKRFLPTIGALIALPLFVRLFIYHKSKAIKAVDIITIVGLIYLFAAMTLFPWKIFPFTLLNFVQFPWRFFEFVSLFLSVSVAYYLSLLLKTNMRRMIIYISLIIIHIPIFIHGSFAYRIMACNSEIPELSFSHGYNGYVGAEYLPAKVPSTDFLFGRKTDSIKTDYNAQIIDFRKDNGNITFEISTEKPNKAELPLTYYKGYKALVDGKNTTVAESKYGLVQIPVNKSGRVEVWYAGTTIQKVSWYVTLISLCMLIIYIFVAAKQRKQKVDDRKDKQ